MESPPPLTLSPSNSPSHRSSTASSSPEFEFWMVGRNNPAINRDSVDLPSADKLFSGGVILPLHLLSTSASQQHHLPHLFPDPILNPGPLVKGETLTSPDSNRTQSGSSDPPEVNHEPGTVPDLNCEPSASIFSSYTAGLTSSKRWRHIFKKTDKGLPETGTSITAHCQKSSVKKEKTEVIKKKLNKKKGSEKGSGGGSSAAELNINLWPFSRSRSAGNNSSSNRWRPRSSVTLGRKATSAPCSRSNSARDQSKSSMKSRPSSSPGRVMMSGGVHVGRNSPVWQVRRNGSGRAGKGGLLIKNDVAEKTNAGGDRVKNRVLNLNVPMCIGYRQNMMSCRNCESFAASKTVGRRGQENSGAPGGGVTSSTGGGGGHLFNLRGLFTKKVY